MPEEIEFPMRINKYLAHQNICSRRKADELIVQGKVMLNGVKAKLGDKVNEEDKVEILGKEKMEEELVYLAFYKPAGVVTHNPQEGEEAIADIIKFSGKIFPIGRLDKDSEGLIIMTNDGRITDKLLNPDFYHEKEYIVGVDKEINQKFIKQISGGIQLDDDCRTRPCEVKKINPHSFSIILTEGKKHQIRLMCEKLGYTVVDLIRSRISNIQLNDLLPGKFRKIKGDELRELMKQINM